MSITEASLLQALKTVADSHTGVDFVTGKQIRNLSIEGLRASLDLELGYPAASVWPSIQAQLQQAAHQHTGLQALDVRFATRIVAHAVQRGVPLIEGVRNIIAVASGKGGVGKSTTAANLALALAAEGAKVGMLDADIYGPSQPLMLGVSGKPESPDGKTIEPLLGHGIPVASIGFLVDADAAMIWRGPMATQAMDQLLRQTRWGELDYLIVDMPPGTGDIHLTLAQRVPITGAVIVTTPQDIALQDAQRGLRMFEKVSINVLGLIENMAVFHCPNCGHEEHIFGAEGGRRMAERYGLELLGSLPLALTIREQSDAGQPTVVADPDGPIAQQYRAIARRMAAKIALLGKDYSARFPSVTVKPA